MSSTIDGEQQYLNLMRQILKDGELKENRTGVDTKSIFSTRMEFDIFDPDGI